MSYKITDTIIVDNNKNIASIGTALFAGPVIIGGGTSTGTVSQPLQVTGTNGAYIGGNLGIGSTNPSSKLWVSGDIYATGIVTAQVLSASKDPGTGIATDFTNSLFGNGWRVSSPGSTTYYKLATLPPGGGGSTFDHLIINGVLGAWTNGNQTPFEITFSNRGSFNYKYVSYGSVRSDVRIIGISTNSNVEIWAQHQASQFTKLVYNIPNSIESIVVSNPTSTTTAPTGTTVFDSSTATPRFIIDESDYVGIGTATPQSALDVRGAITIGVGTVGINSVFSTTDIQSWYYTNKSKSVSGDDTAPQAIYVGASGTAMFMVGDSGNDVNQYTLSTPYDVSTAGASIAAFSVATQETNPLGIDFNPTGTKMFISGAVAAQPGLVAGGEYVHEYSLSTAWTVSSAGYTTSFNVTAQDTAPQGVTFGNSGSKMYVCGSSTDIVYQYSLSTPYSIASGVTYDSISLILGTNPVLLETGPTDISFNSTGTVLWIVGSANDRIYEFRLGTAWNISTAVFYDDVYVGFNEITVTGLHVIPEQNVAYIVGSNSDSVFQYSTNTPALEIASSGISSVSSIVLNNETRVKDKLYVKGLAHFDTNIVTQGNIQVDGNVTSSGTLTANSTITLSGSTTGTIVLGTNQTTATLTVGGATQTGTMSVGVSTVSQTTNIQAGVSGVGTTKTINFGTGGLSGSFTQINIGPTAGVGTITVNSGTTLSVSNQIISTQANSTTTGGGQIYLNGATGNRIDFNTNGVGAPTFTTRSAGTKLVLYPNIGGSTVDYALGIEDGTLWNSVASSARQFKWYAGITTVATLKGTGEFLLGSSTLTGTASQRLQVTGGAYVSGDVGIGISTPSSQLHITGQFQSTNSDVSTTFGTGQIYLNGSGTYGNRIDFNQAGLAPPSTTTRSVGTKILLYPNDPDADYAIGIDAGVLWNSVPSSSRDFKWYAGITTVATLFGSGELVLGTTQTLTGTASQPLQVSGGAYVSGSVGIGTTNPTQPLHVQGNARITGAFRDSTDSPGTTGQILQSTVTGTQWTTAAAGGGSGKFDTTIDNVLYVQPTGTLDIVGVGTTTTQITTLPSGTTKYLVHSLHVTNISNGDAEITAGFVMNARKVPASISVSVGSSGGPGIHTFTVGSASSITVGMAVTGTGNIGETTGIGTTAGFQFNTYVTSVDGNNITLNKPMSGRATGVLYFSPVSKVSSRLPVPVGSAVELLKQPMVLNALDSIVLQSTGAGSGIGSTSTAAITQAANSNFLTVTAGAAITNFLASGMLIQPTGNNTGIQTNTFVGVGYTPGALTIPMTRPATVALASTSLSFTEVVVPQDGALQVTVVYQSSTDTSYLNGTGTVAAAATITSIPAGISSIPVAYYSTGTLYPSIIQSIRVSNISDGIIYPGGDYPVSVGIGNSDTIFSWLAYNMVIPKNSSIELCEAPKRIGIGQSIFAFSNTPYAIEIQIAGKQKTS